MYTRTYTHRQTPNSPLRHILSRMHQSSHWLCVITYDTCWRYLYKSLVQVTFTSDMLSWASYFLYKYLTPKRTQLYSAQVCIQDLAWRRQETGHVSVESNRLESIDQSINQPGTPIVAELLLGNVLWLSALAVCSSGSLRYFLYKFHASLEFKSTRCL